MHKLFLVILSALTTLASPSAASAEAPPKRVAVPAVRTVGNLDPGSVAGLSGLVATEAAKSGLKVFADSDIRDMLGYEKQRELMGCADGSCVVEIGGSLGVDYLLTTEASQVGDVWLLTLALLNTKRTGPALCRATRTAQSQSELVALVGPAVAEVMAAATGARPAPASSSAGASPTEAATTGATKPAGGEPARAATTAQPASTSTAGAASRVLGSLSVYSDAPGKLILEGVERGPVPTRIDDLAPGVYRVKVVFDEGSHWEKEVKVSAGASTRVTPEPSLFHVAGVKRHGLHFGLGAGPRYFFVRSPDGGAQSNGPSLQAHAFLNFGLASALDARAGVEIAVGSPLGGSGSFMAGLPVGLQLHLGSIYSLYFGVRLAGSYLGAVEGRGESGSFVFGPEVSPITLRFGASRNLEVAVKANYCVGLTPNAIYEVAAAMVTVSYLFLE
ncbi:MAG: hypothetical protein QM765_41565 [Myxococcales bacterium]